MTQKQLINANNAELEKHKQDILSLPMADDVKNGRYVWGKYDAKGGTLLAYTVSDSETAYPDGGEKDGFWWEKVETVNSSGMLFEDYDISGHPQRLVFKFGEGITFENLPIIDSENYSMKEIIKYLKEIHINMPVTGEVSDPYFYYFCGKFKFSRKCNTISGTALGNAGNVYLSSTYVHPNKRAVFIPKEVQTVGSKLIPIEQNLKTYPEYKWTIYCEPSSRPNGWASDINQAYYTGSLNTIVWGVTESQFDAL